MEVRKVYEIFYLLQAFYFTNTFIVIQIDHQDYPLRVHCIHFDGCLWDTPQDTDIFEMIRNNYVPQFFLQDLICEIRNLRENIVMEIQGPVGLAPNFMGVMPVASPSRWFHTCFVDTHLVINLANVESHLTLIRAHAEDGFEPLTYHFYAVLQSHPRRYDYILVEWLVLPPLYTGDSSSNSSEHDFIGNFFSNDLK